MAELPATTIPEETAARDYPFADMRFVASELGKLSAKVDRLIEDTKANTAAIDRNTGKIASFETTSKVIGVGVCVIAAVFWWAFGDYVKFIVQDALKLAMRQH